MILFIVNLNDIKAYGLCGLKFLATHKFNSPSDVLYLRAYQIHNPKATTIKFINLYDLKPIIVECEKFKNNSSLETLKMVENKYHLIRSITRGKDLWDYVHDAFHLRYINPDLKYVCLIRRSYLEITKIEQMRYILLKKQIENGKIKPKYLYP